jgi:hypothetical protein
VADFFARAVASFGVFGGPKNTLEFADRIVLPNFCFVNFL